MLRIASWNINSVRLRHNLVEKLSGIASPDILCLQETKTPDEHFPIDQLKSYGYEHQHFHGMKGYNGVAILSRIPFTSKDIHHRVGREDCRHIAVRAQDIEVHNIYIPAGGDDPDPEINDKFAHKLDFVDEMSTWFKDNYTNNDKLVVLGDFNIAPYEHDVWSHKQLLKVVSHSPQETSRLAIMLKSLDWTDSARQFIPLEDKEYTWWSYRNRDWKKSNRGRRLDHIWVTPPLKSKLSTYGTLPDARDWEKPSDHIPLWVDLDL